jgi:hypothetical protein
MLTVHNSAYHDPPMPRPTVLFYVSSHGYGHARRSAEVIRALRRRIPGVAVHVRTGARAEIFDGLVDSPATPSRIDVPIVEHDALAIDWPRTLNTTAECLERMEQAVHDEAAAVRHLAPTLLVADVPFMAGDVAEVLSVPCVAVSNFTWDWIYEPHAGLYPQGEAVLRGARESYGKMRALLQLPFGHDAPAFREVVPVPLIARRSRHDPAYVLARLGLDARDDRPRALVAMRGGVAADTLVRAAENTPGFLFLTPQPLPEGPGKPPANLRRVNVGKGLDFSDLLAVSDVVLSKLGYGTIADCIAAGTRLLWPHRDGFREDEITEAQAPRYLRMAELPRTEFFAGAWRQWLERLTAMPRPAETLRDDGAAVCADILATRFLP